MESRVRNAIMGTSCRLKKVQNKRIQKKRRRQRSVKKSKHGIVFGLDISGRKAAINAKAGTRWIPTILVRSAMQTALKLTGDNHTVRCARTSTIHKLTILVKLHRFACLSPALTPAFTAMESKIDAWYAIVLSNWPQVGFASLVSNTTTQNVNSISLFYPNMKNKLTSTTSKIISTQQIIFYLVNIAFHTHFKVFSHAQSSIKMRIAAFGAFVLIS